MVIYDGLSLSSSLGGEHFIGHWGPLEWVRCSSKTRHIIAVFSHISFKTQSPTEKSASLGKCHLIAWWHFLGRKGSGASKAKRVRAGAHWTWTQVVFGGRLPQWN